MNNQKKSNSLGLLFLIIIVVYVTMSLILGYAGERISVPMWLSLILSELLVVIPAVIYLLINNVNLGGELGFRKIKISTGLMTVLLSFTVMPVVGFVNVLSQFFVSNTMSQASDALLSGSYVVILLLSSLFGPICEEITFRGVFFKEYSKIATPLMAGLISAVFFGLMHLNVNQACYAFVLGVIFAMVNRASGSIVTSVIMHITINLWNMTLMIISSAAFKASGATDSLAQAAEQARTTDMIYIMAGVYLVLALVFGGVSVPIISFIAKNEGREDKLAEFFTWKKAIESNETESANQENEKEAAKSPAKVFLAAPALIAILLSLFVIFGLDPLLTALGWQ